jgi:hypothetical protein
VKTETNISIPLTHCRDAAALLSAFFLRTLLPYARPPTVSICCADRLRVIFEQVSRAHAELLVKLTKRSRLSVGDT